MTYQENLSSIDIEVHSNLLVKAEMYVNDLKPSEKEITLDQVLIMYVRN